MQIGNGSIIYKNANDGSIIYKNANDGSIINKKVKKLSHFTQNCEIFSNCCILQQGLKSF